MAGFSAVSARLELLRPHRADPVTLAGIPPPNVPASIGPLQPDFGRQLTSAEYMGDFRPEQLQDSHTAYDRKDMPIDDGPSNGPIKHTHRLRPFYQTGAGHNFPENTPPPRRYEMVFVERKKKADSIFSMATKSSGRVGDTTGEEEDDMVALAQYSDPGNDLLLSYNQNFDYTVPGVTPRGGALTVINGLLAAMTVNLFNHHSTSANDLEGLRGHYLNDSFIREIREKYYLFGVNYSDGRTSKDQSDTELMRLFPGVTTVDLSPFERVFTSSVRGQVDMWNYMRNVQVIPGSTLWLGLKFVNMTRDTREYRLLCSDVDGGGGKEKTMAFSVQLPLRKVSASGTPMEVRVPVPQYFVVATRNGTPPRSLQEYTYDLPRLVTNPTTGVTTIDYQKVYAKPQWLKLGRLVFDRRGPKGMIPSLASQQVGYDLTWDNVFPPRDMAEVMQWGVIAFLYEKCVWF